MIEECDYNNDGTVTKCEAFECLVEVENEWRAEACPAYGDAYCENPFDDCETCPEGMNCSDLADFTEEAWNSLDTNGDD
jgi:hypothetical protein